MEYSKIGDICLKVCSGGTPTSSNPNYYNGGIPWLNTNEVNFCNIDSTNKTISQEGLEHSAAKYIPANTVIVAMYGVTAGRSAIAKIPLTTNQACCNLVIDAAKADYRYVYYFLKQQSDNLNKLANGGAQQNLNSLIIKKYKIALPNLEVQHRIASILSTYDSLIENNTKRIRLLEKMAENIYKEWFVRFRFPGHENVEMENGLPKGWKVEKLGEWGIELETGKRPKGGIDGSIKEGCPSLGAECIKELASFDYSSVKMVPKDFYDSLKRGKSSGNDILLYKDGAYIGKVTMFRDSFPYSEYSINEHVFFLSPMNVKYRNYLYFTLHQKEFFALMQNLNRNAAQPGLSRSDVERVKIVVPPSKIVEFFDLQVERMLKAIFSLAKQNSLLARQRDLLLPRLMSGKLEVKEELLE